MATRDILRTLKAEHDALRDLFEEMESTTDRTAKKRAELDVAYEEWKASPAAAAFTAMAEAKTGVQATVRRVTRRAQ